MTVKGKLALGCEEVAALLAVTNMGIRDLTALLASPGALEDEPTATQLLLVLGGLKDKFEAAAGMEVGESR